MKVLVTGATGFIGKHVLHVLERKKIDYVILGRGDIDNQIKIQCNLLENDDLVCALKKIKPTHLIHLAWYTEHGKYWESPLNISWLVSSCRLVEAFCQSGGRHVLIAGTCAEYDWRYGYCVEDLTPLNPKTLYGIAKNVTRSLVENVCEKHKVGFVWTRIFFPYGPGESKERLIPSLFGVFQDEKPAFGVNAHVYRDLLHVTDVAEAIAVCSENEALGKINISSAEPLSLEMIVKEIALICKKLPDEVLSLDSPRIGEPKFLVGDNDKLKKLGWKKNISFEQGIKNYKY